MPKGIGYKGSGRKKSALSKGEQKTVNKAFKKRAPLRKALGVVINKATGKPTTSKKRNGRIQSAIDKAFKRIRPF